MPTHSLEINMEFDLYQKIADSYSVDDILCILGITPEDLCRYYLKGLINKHKGDFDV